MSNTVVVVSRTFPGWEAFKARLTRVGPFRVLAHILGIAHAQVKAIGVFAGDDTHTPISHGIMARILLRQVLDNPALISPQVTQLTAPERESVREAFEELNGLIENAALQDHVEGLLQGSVELTRQLARNTWRTHLATVGRSRVVRCEIARTWLLLRDYWPRSRERVQHEQAKNKVIPALRDPLVSAFDSLEYTLALYIAIYNTEFATVVDPTGYFEKTDLAKQLTQAFDLYIPTAEQVVGTWGDIEDQAPFPHRSPFRGAALVRFGTRLLIAPDPGILFSGVGSRLITRAVYTAGATDQIPEASILEGTNTLLGYIYEDYLRDLISDISSFTGERYLQEFKLDDGSDSPDAILRDGCTVVLFECKARGLPIINAQPAPLEDLLQLLRGLAGARPPDKPPFRQLSRFLERWRQGDTRTREHLGLHGWGPRRCVIVSPDGLPNVVFWRLFRNQLVANGLDPREQEAERLVEFASIYDIEILCAACRLLNPKKKTVAASALIERWRNANRKTKGFDRNGSANQVKQSLGDYLLEKHPGINAVSLPRSQQALNAAFAAATATLFTQK